MTRSLFFTSTLTFALGVLAFSGCIMPGDFPAVEKKVAGDLGPTNDTGADSTGDTVEPPDIDGLDQEDADAEVSEIQEIAEVQEIVEIVEVEEVQDVVEVDLECEPRNACGGCAALPHEPETPCGQVDCPEAGEWTCVSSDEVQCSAVCCPAPLSACGPCEEVHETVCGPGGQWVQRSCVPLCQEGELGEIVQPCGYCGSQRVSARCNQSCAWTPTGVVSECEGEGTRWEVRPGPVDDGAGRTNHIGTDGQDLYVIFGDDTFYRYSWPEDASPIAGNWTQLAAPIRPVNATDSLSGLAHQRGFLYTTALHPNGARTLLRYHIASNAWEAWQDGEGQLIAGAFSNAIVMDIGLAGVGYAAQHAGYQWLRFNWDAQWVSDSWLTTSGLPGTPLGWVSRNESVTVDTSGTFYATRNVEGSGVHAGDAIYSFTVAGDGSASGATSVATKPWKAGFGQSVAWIDASKTQSCKPELWLIRGLNPSQQPGGDPTEGFGPPTNDWSRYPLDGSTGARWTSGKLPGDVIGTGEVVRVRDAVFVRGAGLHWYVAELCPCPVTVD